MIETIICNYLSGVLDCPVKATKNDRPPGRSVFVERTGGNGRFIKHTTVAIQSYGTSMYEAAQLNDEVIEKLYGMVTLNEITKVSLNQNYNFTDLETKEYRYQAVFDITHY